MALNLTALAATLQTGKQLSPAESLAIQNVAGEASKDLTLLQSLYNEYTANPSQDILQKIESLIQETSQNLPALLQAAHIGDPVLSARITAAVNLILTTVTVSQLFFHGLHLLPYRHGWRCRGRQGRMLLFLILLFLIPRT